MCRPETSSNHKFDYYFALLFLIFQKHLRKYHLIFVNHYLADNSILYFLAKASNMDILCFKSTYCDNLICYEGLWPLGILGYA